MNSIKKIIMTSALVLVVSLVFVGLTQAATFALLTGQLDYGQTSTNVRNLQIFLASNPDIYPQGLVTGYFGPLTKSAVMNFQSTYNISQAGRVGPITLAKINSLISSGVGLNGIGVGNNTIAPTIYSVSVSVSNTNATVSWSTNEPTKAQVYYSSTPFQLAEATTTFAEPTIIGGWQTPRTEVFQTFQNVVLTNLQPNTMYYYMIEATDTDGNLSYTLPVTFTTSY